MNPVQPSGAALPRVYIVLLNWNGWKDTIACLESLSRLDYANARWVVCDNGSTDDSVSRLRDWAAATGTASGRLSAVEMEREAALAGGVLGSDALLALIQTGANLGFAGGCNVGIAYTMARGDADYVWLLNNDTVVDAQALSALVTRASEPDGPGIVGSTLCYLDAPERVQSLGGGTFNPVRAMTRHIADGEARRELSATEARQVEATMDYVVGASMLVSRRFLDRVGLMQDDYFLYFEEIDWAERARRIDPTLTLGFASRSVVFHKVGASAGTHSRSLLSLRYLTANRLRFVKRFYRSYLPMARLSVLWEGTKALLKGRFSEARLVLRLALSPVNI